MIIRFMRGVFIVKRFKFKYIMIWDVGKVFDYLKLLYLLEKFGYKNFDIKNSFIDSFNNSIKSLNFSIFKN